MTACEGLRVPLPNGADSVRARLTWAQPTKGANRTCQTAFGSRALARHLACAPLGSGAVRPAVSQLRPYSWSSAFLPPFAFAAAAAAAVGQSSVAWNLICSAPATLG